MQEIRISVADDVAAVIKQRVNAGEFANPSAMIEESVRDFVMRQEGFEQWVKEEVLPAIDRDDADPRGHLSGDEVKALLRLDDGEDDRL